MQLNQTANPQPQQGTAQSTKSRCWQHRSAGGRRPIVPTCRVAAVDRLQANEGDGSHPRLTGQTNSQPQTAAVSPVPVALTHEQLEQVAAQLDVPILPVYKLLQNHPELLDTERARQAFVPQVKQLQNALQVPASQVLVMLTRQPALLTCNPTVLSAQLKDMAAVLGISKTVLNGLVAKQPEFLEIPPNRLAMKATQLAMVLRLQPVTGPQPDHAAMQRSQNHSRPASSPAEAEIAYNEQLWHEMRRKTALRGWTSPSLIAPTKLQAVRGKHGVVAADKAHAIGANTPGAGAHSRTTNTYQSQCDVSGRQSQTAATGSERMSPASAAALAGLQVLVRLPPHHFFDLLSLPSNAIVQRALALEEALCLGNPTATGQLLAKCPRLLMQPLQQTLTAWQALLEGPLQGLAPGLQRDWLLRGCSLLCLTLQQLQGSYSSLQKLLNINAKTASRYIRQQPALLTFTSRQLERKLHMMAHILQSDMNQARRVVKGAPSTLLLSASLLQAKQRGLCQLLHANSEQVAHMVLSQPAILTQSTSTLSNKLKQLGTVLPLPAHKIRFLVTTSPTLLTNSPRSIGRKFQALQELFGWTHTELLHIIQQYPKLLVSPLQRVREQLNELVLALEMPLHSTVLPLVRACPVCISGELRSDQVVKALDMLATRLQQKAAAFGVSAGELQQQPQTMHVTNGCESQVHAESQMGSVMVQETDDASAEGHAIEQLHRDSLANDHDRIGVLIDQLISELGSPTFDISEVEQVENQTRCQSFESGLPLVDGEQDSQYSGDLPLVDSRQGDQGSTGNEQQFWLRMAVRVASQWPHIFDTLLQTG